MTTVPSQHMTACSSPLKPRLTLASFAAQLRSERSNAKCSAVGPKAETWVAKCMINWAGTKYDSWSLCLMSLPACNASRCTRFTTASMLSLSAIGCACLRLHGACVPSCWPVLLGHMECGSRSTLFRGASAWTRPQPQVKSAAEGFTYHRLHLSTERPIST